MRRVKWILGGLFAFCVALLVAAYVIVANYPVEDLKALIQREVAAATGRQLDIHGNAQMEVSLQPSIVLEDVRLRNADWAVGQDMVTMRRLEIQVELWPLITGELRIKRFELVEPVIALQRSADGSRNWVLGRETELEAAAREGLGYLPSFESLSVEKARILYKDDRAGVTRTLLLDRLTAEGRDLASPIALRAAGSLEAVPFDLAMTLGSLEQFLSDAPVPLTLQGTLAEARLEASGQLGLGGGGSDLTLALEGASLDSLGGLAGLELAGGPYSLRGRLQGQETAFTLEDLAARFGESDLAGRLAVELTGERPRVTGTLNAERLALADLGLLGEAEAAPADTYIFPATPLPLAALRALDAGLELSVGELRLAATTLTALRMTLALEDGRLAVTPLSAGYGEASLEGALTLDAASEPPALAMTLKGEGLDLALASGGTASGKLSLDVDVTARGDSLRALASTLTGWTAVASDGGRIDSSLLTLASSGVMELLGPLLGGSSEIRLTCLVSRFAWNEGIGSNQGTALEATTFTLIGNGTVNLRDETLDFYVDSWSRDASLMGLAVPMTVRGPLRDPAVAPDPAGTALGLAKAAGRVVFPPAGLAAIISDRAADDSGNACLAVMQEVQSKGGPAAFFEGLGQAADELMKDAGDAATGAGEAIQDGAKDALDGLKSIFD